MYGGKIIRAYSDAPDKNVDGSFGNLLVIRSTINGQQVDIWYCHLNYGTSFASNPLLGRIYQVNDQVYQGDLIGYSGKKGNAYKVPNPHLHLGVKNKDGKWIDPVNYINGSYNFATLQTDKGEIKNIKCD